VKAFGSAQQAGFLRMVMFMCLCFFFPFDSSLEMCYMFFYFFFPFSLRLGWWVCILIFSFVVLGAKGLVAWTR